MRGLLLSIGLIGCYAPRIPNGVTCDPDLPTCPGGQVCVALANGFFCEPDGTLGLDAPAPADADIDAPSLIDAPPGAMRITYPAAVAECVNPAMPNPDACRSANGATEMVVDNDDSQTANPWYGFVRFDFDDQLANKTITAVTVRVTATNNPKAPSNTTGYLWQVTSFTKLSLATTTPSHVGGAALGGQMGAVVQNQNVSWTIPVSLVSANGSLYLGLESPSNDGVNYWNTSGTAPPKLFVDVK